MSNLVFPDLSYTIMGVQYSVHNDLGPTLLEKYYQRAVAVELEKQKFKCKQEVPVKLPYNDTPIANFRAPRLQFERIINTMDHSRPFVYYSC